MSDIQPDEVRIAAEIDQLKAVFPKTRELYREVCALLFFRFGITPTANRLYQLVKRGSMGTPTAVLGEFWMELRAKSRGRVEHPDLPVELQNAAGELVATLWERASDAAQTNLAVLRDETAASIVLAQEEVERSQRALALSETNLTQRDEALVQAQGQILALEQRLAAGAATQEGLAAENVRLLGERTRQEADQQAMRREFSQGLEQLRADAARAEERLRDAEKRALLEIDKERGQVTRLQKELKESAAQSEQFSAEAQTRIAALTSQLQEARLQAGVLEGRLETALRHEKLESTSTPSNVSQARRTSMRMLAVRQKRRQLK